jgi:hypothetical protein
MGKRGKKPKRASPPQWSAEFAYAVGLLATDGSLSNDGRHIVFVSQDREQLENMMRALGIRVSIGEVVSGYTKKKATRIQFGDVVLYRFLLDIGLMPNKTKIIGIIKVPDAYFFDFLRGSLDGDGSFYSYWDPRWPSSFMYYLSFVSASEAHIGWLRQTLQRLLSVKGSISQDRKKNTIQLKYAKKEALTIIRSMYHSKECICLARKKLKIQAALGMMGERF